MISQDHVSSGLHGNKKKHILLANNIITACITGPYLDTDNYQKAMGTEGHTAGQNINFRTVAKCKNPSVHKALLVNKD